MSKEISCVILTKNEKENLKRCLESVDTLDDVIIIDDFSTDRSSEVATKQKFFQRKFDNLINQRKFGARHTSGKWILFLDADECVNKNSLSEIMRAIKAGKKDYYAIPRENVVLGKTLKYGNWYPDYQLRLVKKDYVNHLPPKEKTGRLKVPLIHYSHQNLSEWWKKYWRSTSVQANLRKDLELSSLYNVTKDVYIRLTKHRGYKDGFVGIITILYLLVFELTIIIKLILKNIWRI